MLSEVLRHLEKLQVDLSAIDPQHTYDAADTVAAMAEALRRESEATRPATTRKA